MAPNNEMPPIPCGFCFTNLASLSLSQRHAHCERHLNESDSTTNHIEGSKLAPIDLDSFEPHHLQSKKAPNTGRVVSDKAPDTTRKKFQFIRETDVFWYPEKDASPPAGFIPGLIPLLRKALVRGHDRGLLRRAVLCHEKAVLIHREPWDATWGCGYRNFMMVCSVLMSQQQQPLYFPLLDSPLPPGIRNLQAWIEDAWMHGFDPDGQQQLKTLRGTRKWIGTADLWVAFVFRHIPAELVEFDLKNKPRGFNILTDWIVKYFSPPKAENKPKTENAFTSISVSPILVTEKMPIILQHDGHSRTVIGYEVDKNGTVNLLVFDPAHKPAADIRNLALEQFYQTRTTPGSVTSSPSLKRKRSLDDMENGANAAGSSRFKKFTTSSKILAPFKKGLKNSLNRGAINDDIYSMLKKFRLDPKGIGKNQRYQILYFPMTAPLTEKEQQGMKIVKSVEVS